jgi:DNA-directed RNA polymerase subunit H (RpoH/RPB5)
LSDEDLRFNVLNHVLVPFHEIVDEEELPTVLAQYGIVKEQLPKILSDDPAARVIDAKPGQVVRVVRNSPTAGHHTAYRLVVQAL